jgi:hypothetical protein
LASAALVAAGVVAVQLVTATPARAETSEPSLIVRPDGSSPNTSDPDVQNCSDPATGWSGLCMFTSSDLGREGQWWYPMDTTYLFTLSNGLDPSDPDNWEPGSPFDPNDTGAIFAESQITTDKPGGFVPAGAEHLWAPTYTYWNGQHVLLVPDVEDITSPGVSTTSRIAVATSSSLFGGYTYTTKKYPIAGYASDPYVAIQSGSNPTPFLVYADGDGDNCGGLSIVELNGNDITATVGLPKKMTIDGLGSALGGCNRRAPFSGSTTDPYIEGPQIHYIPPADSGATNGENYYLIFSVQQTGLKQLIAYATASNLTGDTKTINGQPVENVYNYRGVIMAPGDSEFTNHASIAKYLDRYIFAYHDGPGGTPHRKARAACLTFHKGVISPIHRAPDGFARCWAIKDTIALRSRGNGKVVVAHPNGYGVSAANPNIGLWERFDVIWRSSGRISLLAHSNWKYVTADDSLGGLRANADNFGAAAEFALQWNANGSVSLGHPAGGFVAPLLSPPAGAPTLVKTNTPFAPTAGAEFDVVPLRGTFGLRARSTDPDRFVTAPNGSLTPLVASGGSGTTPAEEETFQFDFDSSGLGQARLFWPAASHYVSADERLGSHEERPLIANAPLPLDWETFTLLWNTDGTFSLQSAVNGRFVAAPPGSSLIANRTEIHPAEWSWEKFDLVSAGSGVVW